MNRYSRKREAILKAVEESDSHPSAVSIYEKLKPEFPDLSLATVYRNLKGFSRSGEIASIGTVGSRERFDGRTDPHSHFICDRCGAIYDVVLPDESVIDKAAESIGLGRILKHEVTFHGVCSSCIEKEGKA